MNIKKQILFLLIYLIKSGINIFGFKYKTSIAAHISENLIPIIDVPTDSGTLKFYCLGSVSEWRANTLFDKEPETIEWINTFSEGEVLWDIGANIGVYSIYAALKGMHVLSFEPSPANYFLLSKNIEINQMDKDISGFCVALNDSTKIDTLYMSNTTFGSAMNSFGSAIDWQGNQMNSVFNQSAIGIPVDQFVDVYSPSFPNHIKIDVDGIEDKVIEGALKTLADKRVRSILIELDSEREEYCQSIINKIENSGLTLFKKEHSPMFDNTKFSKSYNYIFTRI